MKWRMIIRGSGTGDRVFRYHVGRKNIVIQRLKPESDRKVVVPFTTLLNLPAEKIWYDDVVDGRVMLVGIEPSDVVKYIDASPLEAFEQPKQKRRK